MNCLNPASFQISLQRGVSALKAECDRASKVHPRASLSPSVFPDFGWHKTAVAWKGCIFFLPWQGWTLPRGGIESKFHIEPHCTPRRIRSIYLTCSLSTCFAEGRRPNEESHWGEKWKSSFFSLSIPIFFCYNDAPGAVGNLEPNGGEQRHHKQRALQLHACGPLRIPPRPKQRPT